MSHNASPPEGTITTERRGPLLLVGINRPAKYNGFTPRMFRELAEAYTLLDDDEKLRVGVLHAFGKHFTAGLDVATRMNALKAVEQGRLAATADFVEMQQRLANTEDAAEGVRSFVEKRLARFKGR